MAEKREERFRMNQQAPFDRTFCRAHVAASVQRDASSPEWKFLHSSPSCTTTLQMAELSPPAQHPPPFGISPNHNGITSKKRPAESDFII